MRGNEAVGRVSDADKGGIYSAMGDLRIESSQIMGNREMPDAHEIGLFAQGRGIFVESGR